HRRLPASGANVTIRTKPVRLEGIGFCGTGTPCTPLKELGARPPSAASFPDGAFTAGEGTSTPERATPARAGDPGACSPRFLERNRHRQECLCHTELR